jgi:CDP-paratose 2-epimerase
MSCIYGPRQQGSEDQGWVAHFMIQALQEKPIILFGDGEQVRDVCHVGDACEAYLKVLEDIDTVSGRAFNWGGGPGNAVSLLTVLDEIGTIIGRPPRVEFADWRPGDQRWFVADTRAAEQVLALRPRTGWREGLRDLHAWLVEASADVQAKPRRARAAAAL